MNEQKPKPPPQLLDMNAVAAALEKAVPEMFSMTASLFGCRTPTFSRRSRNALSKKLKRHLEAARPYLLALSALNGDPSPNACAYALSEGLLREQLRHSGIRVRVGQDSFQRWLEVVERIAFPPLGRLERNEACQIASTVMRDFADALVRSPNGDAIKAILNDWSNSKDARESVQLLAHLPALVRQQRTALPKRFSPTSITQLAREYSESSSLFEQRLKLLLALALASEGDSRPWAKWSREKLSNLLRMAESRPALKPVVALIDPHVRNALAHGRPHLNMDLLQCSFHDRDIVVAWSFAEFFEKTKRLSLAAMSLLRFQVILQCRELESTLRARWKMLEAEQNVSREIQTAP